MAGEIGSIFVNVVANTAKFYSQMDRATRRLDGFGRKATEVTNLLGGVFAGVSAAKLVDGITKATDTLKQMEGKLNLVSASSEEAAKTQKLLFDSAQRTRSELDASVTLYSRLARSTKQLGLNQSQLINITETLNKAIVVSSATNTEAQAAIIQLSQGLASGALRGEEFNSVNEQTPRIMQAIADGMGVNIGKLREYAKQGKLTAEVITNAIQSQSSVIQQEFTKMPLTVEQATTKLKNSLLIMSDAFSPLNDAIAKAINGWATLIDKFTGNEDKQREFNKLLAKRAEYIEALTQRTGRYYTLNKETLKARIDAINQVITLMQNERMEIDKAAAAEAKRKAAAAAKAPKERSTEEQKTYLANLSHVEDLLRSNLSIEEKANMEIDKANALWLGGLTSLEAYEEKLKKIFETWNNPKTEKRFDRLEFSLLSEEEQIHQSYLRRNAEIEKQFANEEELSDKHLNLLLDNNERYQDRLSNLMKQKADEQLDYDRRIARAKASLAQSSVNAIYSIAQIAGEKYFKYAQRIDAAITLMKAYQLAAGAAADTQGDFWTRAATYGAALAMGLGAVAQIKSTTSSGGGGGGAPAITGPTIPNQPQQQPQQQGQTQGQQAIINIFATGGDRTLGDNDKQTVKQWLMDLFENESVIIKRDSAQAYEINQAAGT